MFEKIGSIQETYWHVPESYNKIIWVDVRDLPTHVPIQEHDAMLAIKDNHL